MQPELNKKYLITTDRWFVAPDGEQYRSVFGTVTDILTDKDTLGIETNKDSSNWYVVIGNMILAGCMIHFAIQTEYVTAYPVDHVVEFEGKSHTNTNLKSTVYFADK